MESHVIRRGAVFVRLNKTDTAVGKSVAGLPEELLKRATKKISHFVPLC